MLLLLRLLLLQSPASDAAGLLPHSSCLPPSLLQVPLLPPFAAKPLPADSWPYWSVRVPPSAGTAAITAAANHKATASSCVSSQ